MFLPLGSLGHSLSSVGPRWERSGFFLLLIFGLALIAVLLIAQSWLRRPRLNDVTLTKEDLAELSRLHSIFPSLLTGGLQARQRADAEPHTPQQHAQHPSNSVPPKKSHGEGMDLIDQLQDPSFRKNQQQRRIPVDVAGEDVIVVLHIPKTSGKYLTKKLVLDLQVPQAAKCECRHPVNRTHACKCMAPKPGGIWLYSRITTGWPCGVHPGWSDLTPECISRTLERRDGRQRIRRFLPITMLRSPYHRYLSEWLQVRTYGQWRPYKGLKCFPLSRENSCFENDDWRGVSLDQFLDCSTNPANNRLVRMLANLSVAVNCSKALEWLRPADPSVNQPNNISVALYNASGNPVWRSAVHNLKNLPFFGLTEHQIETEALLIQTFGMRFEKHFLQLTNQLAINDHALNVTEEQQRKIWSLNMLDIALYHYATKLFNIRLGHPEVTNKLPGE